MPRTGLGALYTVPKHGSPQPCGVHSIVTVNLTGQSSNCGPEELNELPMNTQLKPGLDSKAHALLHCTLRFFLIKYLLSNHCVLSFALDISTCSHHVQSSWPPARLASSVSFYRQGTKAWKKQALCLGSNPHPLTKSSTPCMVPELLGSSSLPHSRPASTGEALTENHRSLGTEIIWPSAHAGGC